MSQSDSPSCPLCGGPTGIRFSLPHLCARMDSKPFQICWCPGCDFGLFSPRPSQDELRTYYGGHDYYTHQPEGTDANAGRYSHLPPPSLLDRLRVHLAWRMDRGISVDDALIAGLCAPPASVCDIGCGSGQMLSRLRKRGFDVTGVEPDARARSASEGNAIPIYPDSAEHLPDALRGASFDVVAMVQTLEHCVDPVHAILQAVGLIRPGGYLVLEVPNNRSAFARAYGPSWFHADFGRHLNFFTKQSLIALSRKAGLHVEHVVYSGYVVHARNEWISEEQAIWDWFVKDAGRDAMRGTVRNSRITHWRTLARTIFGPPERKYGLVGMVARKPES